MDYRGLGASGLKVSALSFGAWVTFGIQISDEVAYDCMRKAFDAGVNFFDNAEAYGSGKAESVMGKIIKKAGWKRSELVISTKIFWGGEGPNQRGLSRKHLLEGTLASLDRLQLEYVDLLFCHRADSQTPIEETVRAMSHLIDRGLALYWGTSEWSAEQVRQAHSIARRHDLIPPTMEQPQYNMFHRERVEKEYLRLYDDIGLGLTIWSPLASGLLTGKYNDGVPSGSRLETRGYEWLKDQVLGEKGLQNLEKVRRLQPIAADLDCTLAQLGLAWCLKNPNVSTVITGASRPGQVEENMKTLEVVDRLSADVIERLEEVLDNKPEPETDWR